MFIKFANYLLALIDAFEEDKISNSQYKNVRKSENIIVKILNKLKSQNLLKFRFKNLFKYKNLIKVHNASAIREFNFLSLNNRVTFT